MSNHEEFTVYAKYDYEDHTTNLEIGEVELDPNKMPDRLEINGFIYEVNIELYIRKNITGE